MPKVVVGTVLAIYTATTVDQLPGGTFDNGRLRSKWNAYLRFELEFEGIGESPEVWEIQRNNFLEALRIKFHA